MLDVENSDFLKNGFCLQLCHILPGILNSCQASSNVFPFTSSLTDFHFSTLSFATLISTCITLKLVYMSLEPQDAVNFSFYLQISLYKSCQSIFVLSLERFTADCSLLVMLKFLFLSQFFKEHHFDFLSMSIFEGPFSIKMIFFFSVLGMRQSFSHSHFF